MCIYICIYIYIDREQQQQRERERERERESNREVERVMMLQYRAWCYPDGSLKREGVGFFPDEGFNVVGVQRFRFRV